MNFLEKDLEQIIFEADKSKLVRKGLFIEGKLKRQLNLGKYGIADLVSFVRPSFNDGWHSAGEITVFELKKDEINIYTLLQASRYIKAIKRHLQLNDLHNNYMFKIALVGKSIDLNSDFIFLADTIDGLSIYTYDYGIDGIDFVNVRPHLYSLTNDDYYVKQKRNAK